MTTQEFARAVGVRPYLIARHCRRGKLRATQVKRGRIGNEWQIPETEVATFKLKTRGEVATEQWARRKGTPQRETSAPRPSLAFFVPTDPDRSQEMRQAVMRDAIAGDRAARRTVAQALTLWWNRGAKGQTIVGKEPTALLAAHGG